MTGLLVALGGAAGASGRWLVDRAVARRYGGVLPWGTLSVNIAGSLLLGVLAGAGAATPGWVGPLVGTGLCGALTTFSTFGYETMRLLEDGSWAPALVNVTVTVAAGLGAAAAGWWLGLQW